jgi:hypothetical protein
MCRAVSAWYVAMLLQILMQFVQLSYKGERGSITQDYVLTVSVGGDRRPEQSIHGAE